MTKPLKDKASKLLGMDVQKAKEIEHKEAIKSFKKPKRVGIVDKLKNIVGKRQPNNFDSF